MASASTKQYPLDRFIIYIILTFIDFHSKNDVNKQLLTSYIGNLSEFHCAIRSTLRSTTVTRISGHFSAITLHVGPPT